MSSVVQRRSVAHRRASSAMEPRAVSVDANARVVEHVDVDEFADRGYVSKGVVKVRTFLLASYAQTPAWLKDNPHISSGYRAHFSWRLCMQSMFKLHNETLNVWTHFIGFLIFTFLLCSMVFTLSPYGFDYLHLDEKISAEKLAVYRDHFSRMVDSIRLRAPTWVEISSRMTDLKQEVEEHLRPPENSTAALMLHTLHESVLTIRNAVTGFCETCSLADIDKMRSSLSDQVDHVFNSLPTIPARGTAMESAKHKLQEIASFLKSVRLEVALLPDLDASLNGAMAYLPRWPIAVFIGAACACLLFSAIFHLFYCRSESACCILQQLDYLGICILISGSMIPAIYYGFFCSRFWRGFYIAAGVILPAIAFLTIMSKTFMGPDYRFFRAVIFSSVGLFNIIPISHMVVRMGAMHDFLILFAIGGICYLIGACFYSSQIPERLYPGKFDIWFHSHTIFHVFVVIAALIHYCGLMRFFEWRMMNGCQVINSVARAGMCLR